MQADSSAPQPVWDGYLADPFVFRTGDAFYMIGTGSALVPAPSQGVFPMLSSYDLVQWEYAGQAIPEYDEADGYDYWAPEIAQHDGVFYLYFSIGREGTGHHLRVATSHSPLGPYRDLGIKLTDPEQTPFAIDAHPFRDFDGEWYLFYARDFLTAGPDGRAGTGVVVDRLETMTKLAGDERTVYRAHHDWQRFMKDRPMYGAIYDWHTIEGAFIWKFGAKYYCFYSGGRWDSARYGVDYVVGARTEGPYADSSTEDGPRILRTVDETVIGPGHSSIILGPDGNTTYICYHAWNAERTIRQPYLTKLNWDNDGPLEVQLSSK